MLPAHQDSVSLRDLAKDEWILFGPRVYPLMHDAILNAARSVGIEVRHAHDVLDAQQAVHFVSEHFGVAILTKPAALGYRLEGVVAKPLSDESLWFETSLVVRSDDKSRMVREIIRVFLRKHGPKLLQAKQMDLPLPA